MKKIIIKTIVLVEDSDTNEIERYADSITNDFDIAVEKLYKIQRKIEKDIKEEAQRLTQHND